MNYESILGLIQNALLLIAVAFIFDLAASRWQTGQRSFRQAPVGLALGFIGVTVMLTPWTFVPGIVFDMRSVLLGISGLFFGWVPATIAMVITAAFRFYLGGSGAWTGVAVILASGSIGIAWRYFRRSPLSNITWGELYLFGLVIHLAMLALMLTLPWETALRVLSNIALPVILTYPAGTALLGLLILNRLRRELVEETLRENEEKYRTILESIEDGYFEVDHAGSLTFSNDSLCRILGYSRDELMGMNNRQYMDKENARKVFETFNQVYTTGKAAKALDWKLITKEGTERFVETSISLKRDREGRPIGFQGIARDITERKQLEEETAIIAEIGRVIGSTLEIDEVYERFAAEAQKLIPFDRLAVNLHSLHEENVKVAYNFGEEVFGRSKGDTFPLKGSVSEVLIKTRAGLYSHPENVEEMNHRFPNHLADVQAGMRSLMGVPLIYRDEVIGSLHFRSKEPNAYKEQDLRLAEKIGAHIAGAIANAQLFIDQKRMAAEMEKIVLRDQLTDLYNRRGFITLAEQQLKAANRAKMLKPLTFIDVDGLKTINDELGHEEGDMALIDTANILRRTFRESDIVARLGGDEFAVLAGEMTEPGSEAFSERLQRNIDEYNAKGSRSYTLSISWGTAIYDPESPMSLDQLMSAADGLMYTQKKAKSNRKMSTDVNH
jgi:diguanylate cyclase (GGDEF)-like protein/PAS domain S-box-containing protein